MSAPGPLAFGGHRIGAGWVGIGIAGGAFCVIAAGLLAGGAPGPLLAVGPLCLGFGLVCATTRRVAIDPARRVVAVMRRLLGFGWVQRFPLDRFAAVTVEWSIYRPKHSASDGTLAGDQMHMHYEVWLRGRGASVRLEHLRDAVAAERLALGLARRFGLVAERRGYVREAGPDGRLLSAPRRRGRERIG